MNSREPRKKVSSKLLGQLVRQKRDALGLTQMELAQIAFGDELRASQISELETAPRAQSPQATTISSLRKALGLTDAEIEACRTIVPPATNAEVAQLAKLERVDQSSLSAIDEAVSDIKAELLEARFSNDLLKGLIAQLLESVGKSNSPPYLWPAALRELSAEFIEMQAGRARPANLPKNISVMNLRIDDAISAGNYQSAQNHSAFIVKWAEAAFFENQKSLEFAANNLAIALETSAYLSMIEGNYALARDQYTRIINISGISQEILLRSRRSTRVAFNALVAQTQELSAARAVVTEMQAARILPNVVTFNTLLSKAKGLDEARAIFEDMQAAGIPPNAVTFNTLLSKAKGPDEARAIFEDMQAAGIPPDVVTFSTLLSKAKGPEEARAIFEDMQAAGIPPNAVTFNTLLSKAKGPDEARAIFEDMQAAGIPPDVVTFSTLLNQAKGLDEARTIFKDMRAAGIPPNVVTFSTLLSKAKGPDEARAIFEEMQAAGVPPNVVTFSTLLNQAEGLDEARVIFEDMQAAGIPPNVVTFNTLLSKAKGPDEARAIFEGMQAAGIEANTKTAVTVISKTPDFYSALSFVDSLDRELKIFNSVLYSSLYSRDISMLDSGELIKIFFSGFKQYGEALESPINQYRIKSRYNDAFKISLIYPHTGSATKFFREEYLICQSLFKSEIDSGNDDDNLHYAFGIAAVLNQDWIPAAKHLAIALDRASHSKRVGHINRLMLLLPAASAGD